jgi:glycosyltransferase
VPLISVITITYNSAAVVARALESVRMQTGLDPSLFEHWVIDGGSRDSTMSEVGRFPAVKTLSERDRGISDAFNKGVARAQGQWILFLNSDDRLANPHVLAQFAPELDPAYDVVYGRVAMVDHRDDSLLRTIGTEGAWRSLHRRMTLPHPATFMHRRYFERHGEFDSRFRIAMDYELLLRGLGQTRFKFVPQVVNLFSTGGVSDRSRGYKAARECLEAKKKNRVGNPASRLVWFVALWLHAKADRLTAGIPLLGKAYTWLAIKARQEA